MRPQPKTAIRRALIETYGKRAGNTMVDALESTAIASTDRGSFRYRGITYDWAIDLRLVIEPRR